MTTTLTFVLEEIAHARAPSQHELRDILNDLGLVLGREGGEPFRQALRWGPCQHMPGTIRRRLRGEMHDLRLCPGGRGG